VDANVARDVARRIHRGQFTRSGEPLIDHVERVAFATPDESRAIAYLHDALERGNGAEEELRENGCTDAMYDVLALLTRGPAESYQAHVMRIARARGRRGRIARRIKLADLEDHLRDRSSTASAPNYEWAYQQILAAHREKGARNRHTGSAQPPR
jgi:(p)ppGpp synthase/HD superfamily hydrolase